MYLNKKQWACCLEKFKKDHKGLQEVNKQLLREFIAQCEANLVHVEAMPALKDGKIVWLEEVSRYQLKNVVYPLRKKAKGSISHIVEIVPINKIKKGIFSWLKWIFSFFIRNNSFILIMEHVGPTIKEYYDLEKYLPDKIIKNVIYCYADVYKAGIEIYRPDCNPENFCVDKNELVKRIDIAEADYVHPIENELQLKEYFYQGISRILEDDNLITEEQKSIMNSKISEIASKLIRD